MEAFALVVRAWVQRIGDALIPHFRQFLRFLGLPYCYLYLVDWKRCRRSPLLVALDQLYIFFVLRYFPDNYSNCRLYDLPRREWSYYYGSSYHPFQRARLHRRVQPREYQVLFEDKEVCQQLCVGAGIRIARSAGVLDPDLALVPQLRALTASLGGVRLIAKPVSGASGAGIFFIEGSGDEIRVIRNGAVVDISHFAIGERVLVQHLVEQHAELSRLYSGSVNTIRILTLKVRGGDVHVLSALLRCGIGRAAIDNWSAGGVAVGIDLETGAVMATAFDKSGNEFKQHPDSGIAFGGLRLPKWQEVLDFAIQVQNAFPYHPMLGLDVAVTATGPVIIEINAFPDFILQEQASGPLLKQPRVYRIFKNEGLLFNHKQSNLH